MLVKYLIVVDETRQNEVIKEFMDIYPELTKDIKRIKFPIGYLYCYIYVNLAHDMVQLLIQTNEHFDYDIQLPTYFDIKTIPLMHPALEANKRSTLDAVEKKDIPF